MNRLKNFPFVVLALLSLIQNCTPSEKKADDTGEELRAFIMENMPKTVRECKKDSVGHLALPKPYSVPCVRGGFQDMFYWDTYFTNVGLFRVDDFGQARNNVDNILFLIDSRGFMPNGSNEVFLNRSQPPYASMMVKDIYEISKDKAWLSEASKILEKEYTFWMTKRITPSGLNRYSNHATDAELLEFYDYLVKKRFPNLDTTLYQADSAKIAFASHHLAEAESGWDFNPRFQMHCEDFNPIDLNSNLYFYERNFAYFRKELGLDSVDVWEERSEKRKSLINTHCLNPSNGLFYDYDFKNDKLSDTYSAASMNVLWSGLATQGQADTLISNLAKLEFPYGIAACETGSRQFTYQWDYPNGWASFHYITIKGLDNYGFTEAAKRIAKKYVDSWNAIYKETGNLWEKYNVAEGNLEVKNEYEMPPFMGWTAGSYLYASDYLKGD